MGLIVHHHPDMPKQVCWAKAAPVPAAFVFAQDSTNSRWQSITFIKTTAGGEGGCSHSSALVTISVLLDLPAEAGKPLPAPGDWPGPERYGERVSPHVTTVTGWVMKTKFSYPLNLVYTNF